MYIKGLKTTDNLGHSKLSAVTSATSLIDISASTKIGRPIYFVLPSWNLKTCFFFIHIITTPKLNTKKFQIFVEYSRYFFINRISDFAQKNSIRSLPTSFRTTVRIYCRQVPERVDPTPPNFYWLTDPTTLPPNFVGHIFFTQKNHNEKKNTICC